MSCNKHDTPITIDSYQEWTRTKIKYPQEEEFNYLHSAISEEVGELNGKYAKAIRKSAAVDSDAVFLELGDIFWNACRLADAYGYTASEVLLGNMDKLEGRATRGTIVGEGDYR